MKFEITGLIVPPFTPMNSDGSVNLEPIAAYSAYLKSQRIDNLFVSGTTGEGANLTLPERKTLAEEWMKHGRDKFRRIIIQVGSGNLPETQDLAAHTQQIKADAVAVLPPTYFKPNSVKILGDYIAQVAKVVPEMPVLYYHLPEFTGAYFSMLDLLDEVAGRIPNFAGMKFVTYDLADFGLSQQKYGKEMAIAYGKDQQLLFAAMLGGKSFVGATFNYLGKMNKRMMDLYIANDVTAATALQLRIQRVIRTIQPKGFHGGIHKSVMERISGISLGPSRLPIPPADTKAVDAIIKDLEDIGFFEE